VTDAPARGPRVILRTAIGGERILEMPYGEELPRIC
jgi:hydrogenase maturation factor